MLKKPGIYRKNKGLDKSDNSSALNGTSAQDESLPGPFLILFLPLSPSWSYLF